MQIGRFIVGEGRTLIIAEIGSNHNRSLETALESIDAAAECGADAVKFQSLSQHKLYLAPDAATKALYDQIDLPESWYAPLKKRADECGLLFLSSATYLESVDLLENIGVQAHKIASAQAGVFGQLVEKIARLNKPTLLSTGLLTYDQLAPRVSLFEAARNDQLIILHCNSVYPTPPEQVHLARMEALRRRFGTLVGFSDHTEGVGAAPVAVAMGAVVIEKHFTLSRDLPTPDAPISIEPDTFRHMVEAIRAVESYRGSERRDRLEEPEAAFKESLRYRLVLKNPKKAGEGFSQNDFDFLRHPSGIECDQLEIVAQHMRAKTDLNARTLLGWPLLEGKA